MSGCVCAGASHGPACPLLDYFDHEAEERECRRIEAERRALRKASEASSTSVDLDPLPDSEWSEEWPKENR